MADIPACIAAAQALADAIWAKEAEGVDVSDIHQAAMTGLGVLNAQPEFADNPVIVTRPATASRGAQPMTGGTGDKGSE